MTPFRQDSAFKHLIRAREAAEADTCASTPEGRIAAIILAGLTKVIDAAERQVSLETEAERKADAKWDRDFIASRSGREIDAAFATAPTEQIEQLMGAA